MSEITASPVAGVAEPQPAGKMVLLAFGLTYCADYLLWPARLGLSLGIFIAILGIAAITAQRAERRTIRAWTVLALLLLSAAQTAVAMSFSNIAVASLLLLSLLGDGHFQMLSSANLRVLGAATALIRAPGRWIWLSGCLKRYEDKHANALETRSMQAVRFVRVTAPALALGAIFAVILSGGNAVFRERLWQLMRALSDWVANLDISIGRVSFWGVAVTFLLAFVYPASRFADKWKVPGPLPKWLRRDGSLARWQSGSILAVLNALFCAANTIDVWYLWIRADLPAGVSYSAYVHKGVFDLTLAVILSAVVMVVIFQQETKVVSGRPLKLLAHLWILQNIAMIAGVFLRLKLYVDKFELTTLRCYVMCFLLLVFGGFLFLAWYVERQLGAEWLIQKNLQAAFALFFLLQFANISGWVARWNVAEWKEKPGREIDLEYLVDLGPDAWPSLLTMAEQTRSPELAADATELIAKIANENKDAVMSMNWRSRQFRRDASMKMITSAAVGHGK